MRKTEVHVRPDHGRWGLDVDGVSFGAWPQCRALRLALKTARVISMAPAVTAKVVVHEADGRVRAVLSFGNGLPLRLRRRGDVGRLTEAQVPLALAARYARDLGRAAPI